MGAALLIAGIALGCVVLALGALAVGHSLGALVLMLVVWLATAGAIALPFLQAFGISVLFGLVVNALFLIARAIRGR